MNINNNVIVVYNSSDLKQVLEENNNYNYIYLGSDITLDKGIVINENKEKVIIDGTYNNIRYTLTGINSTLEDDTIKVISNKEIIIKNININYTNIYGVIYVPYSTDYKVNVTFNNVIFNGTQLSFNQYGSTKIIDCNITIKETNSVASQEVCESNYIIIGGNTNITSSSSSAPLFTFRNDISSNVVFLCKSNITISTDEKEFMNGTNKLNFTILHDTSVNLITGNGFASTSVCGANNVLIEERSSLNFIEKSHKRIPMWNIFGSFTMKEGSILDLINSYDNTPSDNYNLHFKGNGPFILDNPKRVSIYTKNANVIYSNNEIPFSIKTRRINLWTNSIDVTSAGSINDLPEYYFKKDNGLIEISGSISSTDTIINSHNFTDKELLEYNIDNFSFQNKKEFSIGSSYINIYPINNTSDKINGYTKNFANILIKYNDVEEIISSDEDGYFEYDLPNVINDNTNIEITSNENGSFIYETRNITTPFEGELSMMDIDNNFIFSLAPISLNPVILPKNKDLTIVIVDTRLNKTKWKLYAYIEKHLTSSLNYVLENALVFKKFNDEVIVLSDNPSLIYEEESTYDGLTTLVYSTDKGPLLDLSNNFLEVNEEYFSDIYFYIEE